MPAQSADDLSRFAALCRYQAMLTLNEATWSNLIGTAIDYERQAELMRHEPVSEKRS